MTLAFLMHPNTVVTGHVCREGNRSAGKDYEGKRIICRARRPFFHAISHHERARRGRKKKSEGSEKRVWRTRSGVESVGGAHTRGTCSFTLRRSAVAGVERESSLGFAPTMLSPLPPLERVLLPRH